MPKKIEETVVEETVVEETPVVEAPVVEKKETPFAPPNSTPNYTKAEFKDLIEKYKTQNPAKYELKKDVLEATLKSLK